MTVAEKLAVLSVAAIVIAAIWTLVFGSWWHWVPVLAAIGISVVVARLLKN